MAPTPGRSSTDRDSSLPFVLSGARASGLLFVEAGEGDGEGLARAGDQGLVGLDLLIGLEDLLLVAGVLALELVELLGGLGEVLVARLDRGLVLGEGAVALGDGVARRGQ